MNTLWANDDSSETKRWNRTIRIGITLPSSCMCVCVCCGGIEIRSELPLKVRSFVSLVFIVMTFYLYSFAFASVHWAKPFFHLIHIHLLFLLFLTLFCFSFIRARFPSLSPPKWNYFDDFVCFFFGNFCSVPLSSFIIIISIYEDTFFVSLTFVFQSTQCGLYDFIGIFYCWASGRFLVPVNY